MEADAPEADREGAIATLKAQVASLADGLAAIQEQLKALLPEKSDNKG